MRRYTTPTHTLTIEGVDLTEAKVWVTYENVKGSFTIDDAVVTFDDDVTTIEASLTEKQTASLSTGNAKVQVNWVLEGRRGATDIKTVKVLDNLLERELL